MRVLVLADDGIYWALFHFMLQTKIGAQTLIVNKSDVGSTVTLRQEAGRAVGVLHDNLRRASNDFEKVIIYYDGGQPVLEGLLRNRFSESTFEIVKDFNHMDRFFQVADMLTFTDKLLFKLEHGIRLTKNEQKFFTDDDVRFIAKLRRTQRF